MESGYTKMSLNFCSQLKRLVHTLEKGRYVKQEKGENVRMNMQMVH